METATLRLFLEVMRQRSFTEVSKAERMAPSSVSRAIAGLESELGVRLFPTRTRYGNASYRVWDWRYYQIG